LKLLPPLIRLNLGKNKQCAIETDSYSSPKERLRSLRLLLAEINFAAAIWAGWLFYFQAIGFSERRFGGVVKL
jgi:hypothetical protein